MSRYSLPEYTSLLKIRLFCVIIGISMIVTLKFTITRTFYAQITAKLKCFCHYVFRQYYNIRSVLSKWMNQLPSFIQKEFFKFQFFLSFASFICYFQLRHGFYERGVQITGVCVDPIGWCSSRQWFTVHCCC